MRVYLKVEGKRLGYPWNLENVQKVKKVLFGHSLFYFQFHFNR